jgi:hypothetical protein
MEKPNLCRFWNGFFLVVFFSSIFGFAFVKKGTVTEAFKIKPSPKPFQLSSTQLQYPFLLSFSEKVPTIT